MKAVGGEKSDNPELVVAVRKWNAGGVDVVETVKKALSRGEPPVVAVVLGDRDPEGERLASELLSLGVPEECLLYRKDGRPIRLSDIVAFGKSVWEKGLRADPVIWDGPPDPVVWEEEKTLEARHPAEPDFVKNPVGAGKPAGRHAKDAKIVWFVSPAPGVGQTTLAVSTLALLASAVNERAALLDLVNPPAAHLHLGNPDFEKVGGLLKADTPWGALYVPESFPGDAESAKEIAAELASAYDRVLVDAPAGWFPDGFTVTVIPEERERLALLKQVGTVMVLNRVRDQGAEYIQRVLENEFGRRADVVVPYDPEVKRANSAPEAMVSDAISRGVGEIIARLGVIGACVS